MSDEVKTVEVIEPEVKSDKPELPTADDAKAKGLTADEVERASKLGMVRKPEEKKPAEPKKEDPKPEAKPEHKKSTLPDFEIKDPEKEKAFLDAFGPGTPQRAMYFRMKNERQIRQAAQAELERERKARTDLESRLKVLEGKKEIDENGNEVDPEDRPLTVKQLRELQRIEQEAYEKLEQEKKQKNEILITAQRTQEEYARSVYPDWDDTAKLAGDLMQHLEELLPEKWQQSKALKLIRDLQVAAAQADKLELDEYHAALIAYEIGQLHPNYGKKAEPDGKLKDPKANGGHTPEEMKRIEKNTQRGASSASIPAGGGRRTVSVDEITLADLNKMPSDRLLKFRQEHPERYRKLMRG